MKLAKISCENIWSVKVGVHLKKFSTPKNCHSVQKNWLIRNKPSKMFFSSAKVVTFRPNLVTLSIIPKFGCVLFSHPSSRFERKSFAAKRLSNRQRMGKLGSSFIASFKTDFSVFAKVVSFEDSKTPSLPPLLFIIHTSQRGAGTLGRSLHAV